MKARIYVRVARSKKGGKLKVATTVSPAHGALSERRGANEVDLPTAMFALDLEIPEEALRRAEQVAATVALDAAAGQVLVTQPEPDEGGAE